MPDIPLSVGGKLELLRAFVRVSILPCIICYRPIQCIYMTEAPRVLHFSAFIVSGKTKAEVKNWRWEVVQLFESQ